MLVYKFRKDGVYVGETLEVVGPGIPEGVTLTPPPEVSTNQFVMFNGVDGWSVIDGPTPEFIDEEQKQINKQKSLLLLAESDWVEYPSVIDPNNEPHLLNVAEWLSYRVALRAIAVNPTDSKDIQFPVKPQENWSTNAPVNIDLTRIGS